MATYKVIQDIEAEDKFFGPLTFKQFIFGAIGAICGYLSFFAVTKNAAFLLVVLLPIMAASAFLAWPWRRDQPTEVWAAAKFRFMFKPRKRVWDQSGMSHMVTITAPKKIEQTKTDNLSPTEFKSRLKALAETIDSRGWAIKNVNINDYAHPNPLAINNSSDRLIDINTIMPREVPTIDIRPDEDMFDPQNNVTAAHLGQMLNQSDQSYKQELVERVKQMSQHPDQVGIPTNYWFLHENYTAPTKPGYSIFRDSNVVMPGTQDPTAPPKAPMTQEEQALLEKIHKEKDRPEYSPHSHLKVIEPPGSKKKHKPKAKSKAKQEAAPPVAPVTPPPDPGILELANKNDWTIDTIARQANKRTQDKDQSGDDEVVISLH